MPRIRRIAPNSGEWQSAHSPDLRLAGYLKTDPYVFPGFPFHRLHGGDVLDDRRRRFFDKRIRPRPHRLNRHRRMQINSGRNETKIKLTAEFRKHRLMGIENPTADTL